MLMFGMASWRPAGYLAGVPGIGAGLSVGYTIWLARSGLILASALSSLPAWRFIDPLPVLASGASVEDEDDETLVSIAESTRKPDDEEAVDD